MDQNRIFHVAKKGHHLQLIAEPTGATTVILDKTSNTDPLILPTSKLGTTQEAIAYIGNAFGEGETNQQVLESFTDQPGYSGEANQLRQFIQPLASMASG